jgi:NADH-quinone oxidoreductase subunit C
VTTAIGDPDLVARRLGEAMGLGPDDDPLAAEDAQGVVCVDVPAERWHDAVAAARDRLGTDFFDWLSAVDEPDADPAAVDVLAHLVVSRSGGEGIGERSGLVRLLLRTRVRADELRLASVTDLYLGAAWHERETHEMFGLDFPGFDDGARTADGEPLGLRPLLLPDGFEGTPLRKSFVLAARASKPWPGAKEPGESDAGPPSRRKMLPPGVPDATTWGPRDA